MSSRRRYARCFVLLPHVRCTQSPNKTVLYSRAQILGLTGPVKLNTRAYKCWHIRHSLFSKFSLFIFIDSMAHLVAWPQKIFFYPIGNTPAVCLTSELPPEQSAEILLLGCGDVRNILYTAYADLGARE